MFTNRKAQIDSVCVWQTSVAMNRNLVVTCSVPSFTALILHKYVPPQFSSSNEFKMLSTSSFESYFTVHTISSNCAFYVWEQRIHLFHKCTITSLNYIISSSSLCNQLREKLVLITAVLVWNSACFIYALFCLCVDMTSIQFLVWLHIVYIVPSCLVWHGLMKIKWFFYRLKICVHTDCLALLQNTVYFPSFRKMWMNKCCTCTRRKLAKNTTLMFDPKWWSSKTYFLKLQLYFLKQ